MDGDNDHRASGAFTTGDLSIGAWSALTIPKRSKWQCYLVGAPDDVPGSVVFTPVEGQEPNWFWRKMHYLAFGLKWIKSE